MLSRVPLIQSGYKDPVKHTALQEQVKALMTKGAIEKVDNPGSEGFYSRVFLVPKKSGGWRPVIDLSVLNQFLEVPKFKMETPESIRVSLQQGEWLTSIDLSDAYLHVPVARSCRKFLRFQVDGQVYQFRAMPFGLATAPRVFTFLVKEFKVIATRKGLHPHQYLDDWLLRSQTERESSQEIQELQELATLFGFLVNQEKSDLVPKQVTTFVGTKYDLVRALVFPTDERVEKLKAQINSLLVRDSVTARQIMSVLGLMASTEKVVPLGRLHMRPLQRNLQLYWNYRSPLDQVVPLLEEVREHLLWWLQDKNLLKGAPLHPPASQIQIFTDASTEGWGVLCLNETASGFWNSEESQKHINWLELKTVLLALKKFHNILQGKVVLVATDNSTVVAQVNKQGGTHSWDLCALLWQILTWCAKHRITLQARHIPGCLNVIADNLSRKNQVIHTEWSLHPEVFRTL